MAKDENENVTIDNTEALDKVAEMTNVPKEVETAPIVKAEETQMLTVPIVKVENTDIVAQTETVIVFRATRPLIDCEYEELEKRVRLENQKSGLKIVLAPFSVDVEIKQV